MRVLSWLASPSLEFAEKAEVVSDLLLIFMTFIVVVGLIGEYMKGSWWKVRHPVFEMLVLLGVAGEMVFEGGAFWFASRARAADDITIQGARTDAANANREAGRLGVDVKNLAAFVERQRSEVAVSLTNLNNTQAALDAALEKANERAAPRVMLPQKREELTARLKLLVNAKDATIKVDSSVGNLDAKAYGTLLASVLSNAFGTPIMPPAGLSTCVECVEVWVAVDEDATQETKDTAFALTEAFKAEAVNGAKFARDPANGGGSPTLIRVIVGPKEQ